MQTERYRTNKILSRHGKLMPNRIFFLAEGRINAHFPLYLLLKLKLKDGVCIQIYRPLCIQIYRPLCIQIYRPLCIQI
jgi:hypothetical protein